jgi:hypothetical protein
VRPVLRRRFALLVVLRQGCPCERNSEMRSAAVLPTAINSEEFFAIMKSSGTIDD